MAAHSGRYKFYRSDRLEEQFVELLRCLSVEDGLIERFIKTEHQGSDDATRAQLASVRGDLSRIDVRRRAVFSAFEDGSLARADLQWRLDDLEAQRIELETRGTALERELAGALAEKRSVAEIRTLVEKASSLWSTAAIDDQRALSKAIGNAFGGLNVRVDGTLVLGSPATTPVRSPRLLSR